ncbi:MAG: hypothetical protein ACJAYN_000483 [Bermanella sp.]
MHQAIIPLGGGDPSLGRKPQRLQVNATSFHVYSRHIRSAQNHQTRAQLVGKARYFLGGDVCIVKLAVMPATLILN